jgi:catechol 2,3-dioxygenase-like lactoylglutathione lyase family enzyme
MAIQHFSHIAIRVADMERSRRFYRDTLGFAEVSELTVADAPSFRAAGIEHATMHAVFLRREGVVVELQDVRTDAGEPIDVQLSPLGLRHLSLRVSGMDGVLDEVTRGGGSVLVESRHRDPGWQSDVLFINDPDGVRIELLELPGDPSVPPGTPLR